MPCRCPKTTSARQAPRRGAQPFDLGPGELARLTGAEPFQRQPGVAAAMECADRVPDPGQHPLDLVLATFVDRELNAGGGKSSCVGRRRRAVVELDAAF